MKIYYCKKINDYLFTGITPGIYKNLTFKFTHYDLMGQIGYGWFPYVTPSTEIELIVEIED